QTLRDDLPTILLQIFRNITMKGLHFLLLHFTWHCLFAWYLDRIQIITVILAATEEREMYLNYIPHYRPSSRLAPVEAHKYSKTRCSSHYRWNYGGSTGGSTGSTMSTMMG
ncbi:hypothetical protein Ocin01_19296, partial [Orchesella cincta]